MSSRNMLTLMWWPSKATGGVSSSSNSGKSAVYFSWVWKIENVNKWSDYLKWNGCPTVMIISIAWLYIDQHYEKGEKNIVPYLQDEMWMMIMCSTNYIVQLEFAGNKCEFVSEWMSENIDTCSHQSKSVYFSILIYKLNQNSVRLYIFFNQEKKKTTTFLPHPCIHIGARLTRANK